MSQPQSVALNIINRGFSRLGTNGPPSKSRKTPQYIPLTVGSIIVPGQSDIWEHLQWWESPLNAQKGIKALCNQPFLQWKNNQTSSSTYINTRLLYSHAIAPSDTERIKESASFISASVRQARELYAASETVGISDLSKPQLYFYGALSLAQAASAAIFGLQPNEGHGLAVPSKNVDWPKFIYMQQSGEFANFYRTARYDELYNDSFERSLWKQWKKSETREQAPKIHILECIRCMDYNWGILPPTDLEHSSDAVFRRKPRELLLLQYNENNGDTYQTRSFKNNTNYIEVPSMLILYMMLFYFSVLSRYHINKWQELLSGVKDPEGFVFRIAMPQVANDFLKEVATLLPIQEQPNRYLGPVAWELHKPDWNLDYQSPTEDKTSNPAFSITYYQLPEWEEPKP